MSSFFGNSTSKRQVVVGYYYQRVHSQNETIRKDRPWPPYGFKPVLTIRKNFVLQDTGAIC